MITTGTEGGSVITHSVSPLHQLGEVAFAFRPLPPARMAMINIESMRCAVVRAQNHNTPPPQLHRSQYNPAHESASIQHRSSFQVSVSLSVRYTLVPTVTVCDWLRVGVPSSSWLRAMLSVPPVPSLHPASQPSPSFTASHLPVRSGTLFLITRRPKRVMATSDSAHWARKGCVGQASWSRTVTRRTAHSSPDSQLGFDGARCYGVLHPHLELK
mgnify:CR=1 FL=1